MSSLNVTESSWLAEIHYVPLADTFKELLNPSQRRSGMLTVKTKDGNEYAYLVPAWLPGLIAASTSKGHAINRLVRGKYSSVKLQEISGE